MKETQAKPRTIPPLPLMFVQSRMNLIILTTGGKQCLR